MMMTQFLKSAGLLVLIAMLFVTDVPFAEAASREFHIRQIDITAEVRTDGTVHISETRTFEFTGSFSWYQQEINKRGFSEIQDITISENGRELEFSDTNDAGTYSIRDGRNTVEIRTNFAAEDEQKSFTLSYVLQDAVAARDDWAEFNWTYIGSGWDRPHENISITIILPEDVSPQNIYAFENARASNSRLETGENQIRFTAESLRSGRALELRTIFPSEYVSNTIPTDATLDPAVIQQRIDAQLQAEAEREALRLERAEWMIPLGYFLILLSLLFTIYMVLRFGRRSEVSFQGSSFADRPPSVMEPALIGWLFRYRYSGHQQRFVASIFDLARKGYFRLSQEKTQSSILKTEKDVFMLERTDKSVSENLKPWEKDLINLLEDRLQGQKKTFEELFKDPKSKTGGPDFTTWWNAWFSEIGKEARTNNWYIDNTKPISALIVVQSLFLVMAFGLAIYIGSINAAPAIGLMIVSAAGAFAAFMLNVRSEEGEILFREWTAYYSALREGKVRLTDDLKGLHIIYGILFGLSGKRMTNLINSMNVNDNDITWMLLIPGTVPNAAMFGQAVNSMVQSTTTSISTGSVGATGGVAGGGGGGSAG